MVRRMQIIVVLLAALVGTAIGLIVRAPAAQPPPDGSLLVRGGGLAVEVGGHARQAVLTGINAYQLTSDWSVNYGCGYGGWTDGTLDAFFAGLRPGSLIRTWFFQSMATTGGQRNWAALDRVVSDATRHGVRIIAVLGNGNGACDDDRWKDASWYGGGYESAAGGLTSYGAWVRAVVDRYSRSRAVSVWEPVNEPNPVDCPSDQGCASTGLCPSQAHATTALNSFFTAMGDEIHRRAPGSLVADGSLGSGNCGTKTVAAYRAAIDTQGLDIVTYHDYSGASTKLPSDLPARLRAASGLGKATIIEESGITGCGTGHERASDYAKKITAAFAAGASAYLPWWYGDNSDPTTCDGPIDHRSATWQMLQSRAWLPVSHPTDDLR